MIFLVLPDPFDEDRILAQARQGDQEAVMQLYDRYLSPIYQFIRLRVGDADSAQDITAQVFMKFVEALPGPTAPRQHLRGWLFRVAHNELYNHYGRESQIPMDTLEEWLPAPTESQPEAQFMQHHSIEETRNALQQLSPDQQEVLILRFGQMLSLQETADIMDRSISAVKSLQVRALNTLRHIFTETQGGRSYV